MLPKKEFFITLPSNVKTRGNVETNVISNYKTELKQRFSFPQNENWKVGLAEIIYTKTWFNVTEPDPIIFISEKGDVIEFTPVTLVEDVTKPPEDLIDSIAPGYYNDVQELIDEINRKICNANFLVSRLPYLFYDKFRKIVSMRVGKFPNGTKFIPILGEEIDNILGLIDGNNFSIPEKIKTNALTRESGKGQNFEEIDHSFINGNFMASRIADINAGLNAFFVYSDIIQSSCVGDSSAQLLRTIPVKSETKWGDVVHLVFSKPHLIPLQSRNFTTIEIDLRDDSGAKIPFENGRVIVKLVFDQK